MAAVAVLSPMTHDNEACASDISALVSVDFDSWSKARLNSLCDAMKKQNCGVCDITPNGWQQVAKAVGAEPSKLREAVLHEFRNDIQPLCTPVDWPESRNRHLLIGTLSSAQSRLLVVYYNIRKILQLFSAPVDELWSGEGVTYKMMVLDASNDLFPALDECMEFLAPSTQSCGVPGPDAALVCCGTGIRRGHQWTYLEGVPPWWVGTARGYLTPSKCGSGAWSQRMQQGGRRCLHLRALPRSSPPQDNPPRHLRL